jgi:3-phenylpropionate/trans-cinnamate dioxygenase ferredoxin reductase subunit
MSEQTKYLLVGAGLAAHHAARAIREHDQAGRIVIVGDEPELPYTRPHLSKAYLMGKRERAKVIVKSIEYYSHELQVEVQTGRRVTALDAKKCTALIDDGASIGFERALLATGSAPRRLSVPGADLPGIFYLRTLADADMIKQAMETAKRAVVIGGGFIGAELASSLAQKGIVVTCVVLEDALLKNQIGPVGKFLTDYFQEKGVNILRRARVQGITRKDRGLQITLVDNVRLKADLIVVGIGVTPRVELAQQAGLKVDDGVVVNEYLRTSDPAVYAAGDIAHYHDRRYDQRLRLEHWDNAIAMGKIAGSNMAGANQPFDHVPYLYSDLFDLDLQAYGDLYHWDAVIVRGSLGHDLTYFYLRQHRLVAGLAINPAQDEASALQKLIAAAPEIHDLRALGDVSVPYVKLMSSGL